MEEKECPWCESSLSLEEGWHQGSHGKMWIIRCAKCHKLISVRLEGEPNQIIKKELVEGGAL